MIRSHRPQFTPSFSRPASGALLLALLTLTGCHGSGSSSDSSAAAKADTAKPNYTVVRAGHPPTSTIVTNGAHLQIVDVGEDRNNPLNKVILDIKVPPNSVVTLNTTGVTINARPTTAKGPYDRKHTYEFRLLQ